jgi:hypothetical protein
MSIVVSLQVVMFEWYPCSLVCKFIECMLYFFVLCSNTLVLVSKIINGCCLGHSID